MEDVPLDKTVFNQPSIASMAIDREELTVRLEYITLPDFGIILEIMRVVQAKSPPLGRRMGFSYTLEASCAKIDQGVNYFFQVEFEFQDHFDLFISICQRQPRNGVITNDSPINPRPTVQEPSDPDIEMDTGS